MYIYSYICNKIYSCDCCYFTRIVYLCLILARAEESGREQPAVQQIETKRPRSVRDKSPWFNKPTEDLLVLRFQQVFHAFAFFSADSISR